jgi:hypothetical protein
MHLRKTCLQSPILCSNFLFKIFHAPKIDSEVSETACLLSGYASGIML